MTTRARHVGFLALGIAGALAAACSKTAKLDGAKAEIPVYAPSSLEDEHTATTSDDLHDVTKFSTHSWDVRTADGWEAVDAFYKEKLPAAKRVDEDEDGTSDEVVYTWIPPGWTGGAKVTITIPKGRKDGKTQVYISQDILNH